MWTMIKKLEIRRVQGEDVNHVVSLLNAAHSAFRAVSADKEGMNCVPQDWSEQVIKIFQTSSVSKFNEIFEHEEELVHRNVARTLGHPVWPVHDELMTLASRQYERFKQANEWHVSKAISKKGYLTQTSGIRDLSKAVCDNCGKTGHLSTNCTQPKDPERCARNRKKRLEKMKQTRSKSGHGPKANKTSTSGGPNLTKDADGNVLIDGLVYKFTKDNTLHCADPRKQQERTERRARQRAAHAAQSTTNVTSGASRQPSAPSAMTMRSNPTSSSQPTTSNENRRNMSNMFSSLA